MPFAIDKTLHWTDHYAEYGFAVVKHAITDDFIKPAMEEVKRLLGTDLPPNQWTHEAKHTVHKPYDKATMSVLPRIYDQPGLRAIIDTMFASPDEWNGERAFQLFVSAYNAEAQPAVSPRGHIDFVNSPIPIFGSGFMFQASLIDAEPFSGNITIYPGSHKPVQKRLMENPELQWPTDETLNGYLACEPFEFIAEKGDVLLFHHLVGHAGNSNHAANRTPRVVIHGQGLRKEWLNETNPANIKVGPWEKSLAQNGPYRVVHDELQWIMDFKKQTKPAKAAAY